MRTTSSNFSRLKKQLYRLAASPLRTRAAQNRADTFPQLYQRSTYVHLVWQQHRAKAIGGCLTYYIYGVVRMPHPWSYICSLVQKYVHPPACCFRKMLSAPAPVHRGAHVRYSIQLPACGQTHRLVA